MMQKSYLCDFVNEHIKDVLSKKVSAQKQRKCSSYNGLIYSKLSG